MKFPISQTQLSSSDETYVDSNKSVKSNKSLSSDDDTDKNLSSAGKECTYIDMYILDCAQYSKGPLINCAKKGCKIFITLTA
eukprot:11243119-Ditylum_brightwellii.AAC.1